jgi:molybdenum-dependent DNA-binding transcriptional regulator ModE
MNQLQAIRVYTRVVELGSFTIAARQLGMSAAAVTRYVGTLEAHMNTRLLNRNTRSLSLTEIGNDYLKGCRSLIGQLEQLESSLLQANREVRGTLRVSAPTGYVASGLAELLAGYQAVQPRARASSRRRGDARRRSAQRGQAHPKSIDVAVPRWRGQLSRRRHRSDRRAADAARRALASNSTFGGNRRLIEALGGAWNVPSRVVTTSP